jgi:hypothetical protein
LCENLREGDHLEDPEVDEDNTEMDLREVGWGGMDVAQDRNTWQALVNAVMNLRVP